MSRWMQIDIRLLPVYGPGGLRKVFPKIAAFLKERGYERSLEQEPSLYHLVEVLERVHKDPHVPSPEKRALEAGFDCLVAVRDEARLHLLARRLNELERSLYLLEDLFQDLERDLKV